MKQYQNIFIAVLAFHPSLLFAQSQTRDSTRSHQLEKVIIRGQKNTLRSTSATPAQLLTSLDLDRVMSLSVGDAVRYFSGVQLKDYGGVGGLKTINVRSLGTNHTGVFYDGVELGNAQNGQVDLGKFSLDNIATIELYDGQKSTIFQPAKGFASGNALYLSSKTPQFESGKRSNTQLRFRTGSFSLIDPSVKWEYKLNEMISTNLSAEWIHSNGKYRFRYTNGNYDTSAIRQNGDIDALRIEAGLNGRGRDSSSWMFKAYTYHSERGLPGAIVANKFDYTQRQWDKNIFLQTSYQKDFRNRFGLQAHIKYANDYTRYLDPDVITTSGFLNNRYAQQELYGSVAGVYHLNPVWDISLSQDYLWNKLDANLYRFPYPIRQTFLSAVASELHFPRINIQGNLLGTFVKDVVKSGQSAGTKDELTPGLLFSWQPLRSNVFHIRGFYKKIFRMPTFNDLYYTFVGNTFLKPEYATQYDLGLTFNKVFTNHVFNFLTAQTDVYYNKVTDKIVAIPGANLFRWTMYNLGKVDIKGLELNIQGGANINKDWELRVAVSYTYQKAIDVTGDENYREQIPYVPVNSGSAITEIIYREFSLNYSFLYTGYRYSQKANIAVNYLQPWYTHDLSIAWRGKHKHKTMSMGVEVNNLLDQHYDVISNFPMPGRSTRISLGYQL